MKKLIVLLAFLVAGLSEVLINPSFCQPFRGDAIKPLPQVNKEFLVVAHIVLSKNGAAGLSQLEISSVLNQVNTAFAPIGVSFKLCQVDYINNFQYDSLNGVGPSVNNLSVDYMKEVFVQYNIERRINMYFMTEFINAYKPYCGFASGGGLTSTSKRRGIVIKKGCNDPITVGHEFGHFLSLEHTFEGNGDENVDGSNCSTSGDHVCDTPADPFRETAPELYYNKDACYFTYKGKDANGQYYDPDLGNIMSYYGACVCLKFTNGQLKKMADYYLDYIKTNPSISIAW
ncbi:M43 family zinc metalloprotease [Sporocytophaga myxococcoides]|uniref:M43 family zinc metalloprotease n=1 Tax=Sporocytophaga myxococcoides TaxID=153721 RepID=UPI00040B7F42|nr:M43 family zinc metalloprotease [Sporocytophaga myxococcoides]